MSAITSNVQARESVHEQTGLWSALAAALLGAVILYGVGFAPLAVHNAAHDARHSAAFPCH